MTSTLFEGGCQCGTIRYAINGTPIMVAVCHCTMCRRANAAPAVAWAMFKQAEVNFLAAHPKLYASSQEAQRGFCEHCGTQISFLASFLPGLVDITVGSLDDPDLLPPQFHYSYATHLGWFEAADTLPKYPGLPPQAGE